jgi:hypothetical protein
LLLQVHLPSEILCSKGLKVGIPPTSKSSVIFQTYTTERHVHVHRHARKTRSISAAVSPFAIFAHALPVGRHRPAAAIYVNFSDHASWLKRRWQAHSKPDTTQIRRPNLLNKSDSYSLGFSASTTRQPSVDFPPPGSQPFWKQP